MIYLLVEHSHVNMNQSARLTWCVDDDALRIAVANSMFPGESLDETEAQEVTGVVESLLEDGIYYFEGDPPIQLIRGESIVARAVNDLGKKWRDEAMYYAPQSDARRACVNHADDLVEALKDTP